MLDATLCYMLDTTWCYIILHAPHHAHLSVVASHYRKCPGKTKGHTLFNQCRKNIHTGCPKKTLFSGILAITPLWKVLEIFEILKYKLLNSWWKIDKCYPDAFRVPKCLKMCCVVVMKSSLLTSIMFFFIYAVWKFFCLQRWHWK